MPGTVRLIEPSDPAIKIPHMGWNSATATRGETRVWQGLGEDPYFYYIHSYFPEPRDPSAVVAATTHGTQKFAGAVERGNLFACQFHPEFLSRPGKPHPLFRGLIEAAQLRREGVAQDRQVPADGVPLQV